MYDNAFGARAVMCGCLFLRIFRVFRGAGVPGFTWGGCSRFSGIFWRENGFDLCEKIYFFYDLNLSLFCHFFVSLYVFTGTGLGVVF